MSVGKGSIERAAKAKGTAEKKEISAEAAVVEKTAESAAEKKETVKTAPKKSAAGKTVKKAPEKKKETVAAASVITSDDIHEKKFEAVSRIYCELPTYLL